MEARHKFIIRRLKNFFWCYYFLLVIKKDFWLNKFFFSNTIEIFYTVPVCTSVAELEPPGAATFRAAQLHLLGKQKRKHCSCVKYDIKSSLEG